MKSMFSFSLYVQAIKRIRILGLALTVCVVVINLAGINDPYISQAGKCYYCWKGLLHYGFITSSYMIVLVPVAVLLTFYMFSYLNKRSSADFYHSLPKKRSAVFISQWAAVLTWLFATVVISVSANHLRWFLEGGVVHFYVWFNSVVSLCALAFYFSACTVLGTMFTGTAISAAFSTGAIALLPPFIMSRFQTALESAFPRMVVEKTVFKYIGADNFLPTRMFLNGVTERDFDLDVPLLISVIFALALGAVACIAYTRRESEKAARWGFVNKVKLLSWGIAVCAVPMALVGGVGVTTAIMKANDPTDPSKIENFVIYGNFYVENVVVEDPDGIVIESDEVFKSLSENYNYTIPKNVFYPRNTIKINYKNGKSVYRKVRIIGELKGAIGSYIMSDAKLTKLVYPLPEWDDLVKESCDEEVDKTLWDTFTKEYYKLGVVDRYMIRGKQEHTDRDYEYYTFDVVYKDKNGITYRRYYADPKRTKQTYKLLREGW